MKNRRKLCKLFHVTDRDLTISGGAAFTRVMRADGKVANVVAIDKEGWANGIDVPSGVFLSSLDFSNVEISWISGFPLSEEDKFLLGEQYSVMLEEIYHQLQDTPREQF